MPIEVRCAVKGQAPWQVKLKTRAERCTGMYEPVTDELVNGRPCYKKVAAAAGSLLAQGRPALLRS